MDRRRTSRHSLSVDARPTARLTLLSADGLSDLSFDVQIADWSDRGLRVVTAQSVLTGTPVRLELPDRLLLGDVCYCAIQGDFHAVGVRVSQSLEGLTGLRRLAARLMGEPREQRTLTSQP